MGRNPVGVAESSVAFPRVEATLGIETNRFNRNAVASTAIFRLRFVSGPHWRNPVGVAESSVESPGVEATLGFGAQPLRGIFATTNLWRII